MTTEAPDASAIVQAAANGLTPRDIATAHGMTQAAVREIIDQEAARCFDGEYLRRELLLETKRLDALGAKYFARAMAGEGDINAGVLYVKISERKSALTGLNPTAGFAVQIIHQVAPPRPRTTTEEIGALIDDIRAKSDGSGKSN
jgi:hypothetical protein